MLSTIVCDAHFAIKSDISHAKSWTTQMFLKDSLWEMQIGLPCYVPLEEYRVSLQLGEQ